MQHDLRAYLWDVRQAADAILDFVAGIDLKTYAVVEHPRVWRIVQESLPPLRAKVAALLDELGPP